MGVKRMDFLALMKQLVCGDTWLIRNMKNLVWLFAATGRSVTLSPLPPWRDTTAGIDHKQQFSVPVSQPFTVALVQ